MLSFVRSLVSCKTKPILVGSWHAGQDGRDNALRRHYKRRPKHAKRSQTWAGWGIWGDGPWGARRAKRSQSGDPPAIRGAMLQNEPNFQADGIPQYSTIPPFHSLPIVRNEANVRQDKLGKEEVHG